ncbi:hypothetical protein GH714_025391 [Hevea brasiliensis]|uniref:Uncharacterized protein n=1 Tax=Hevea brasiliensis TaxID=3981 RepID=A0A6A6NIX9_HEVBR|nr:hypothetical protein GH714_025391 [Hevea brasiliensis]
MLSSVEEDAQHRNQYYSRVKAYKQARLGSSPSRHFRGINCRTFQSGSRVLPTSFNTCGTTVTKGTLSTPTSSSQKTPSPTIKAASNSHTVDNTHFKAAPKSSPIPINIPSRETPFNDELVSRVRICHSESSGLDLLTQIRHRQFPSNSKVFNEAKTNRIA